MSETAREGKDLALWALDLEPAERARRMIATYKHISKLDTEMDRREYDLFNLRLYSRNNDQLLYDSTSEDFVETGRFLIAPTENSKNNRAKAAIDTLASQIASTDTRARCEVINGDYKIRRRGRLFQDFTDGLVEDLKLQRLRRRAFMDSAIFESGVGVVQLYRKGDRCAARRVLPCELAIDPRDGRVDGKPRTLYWGRPMQRQQAMEEFGKTKAAREAIEAMAPMPSDGTPIDELMIYESWTLPSGPDAKDGWHIVALDTEGGDLIVKPYKKDFHELVFFAIEERTTGAWGNSLMSQARDLQIRINANDYRIEKSTRIYHSQHLYAQQGTLQRSKLTNELGTLWEGTSPNAPQVIEFKCAAPELYQQRKEDGERIFEDLGVNLQSSQGSTEAGLNASGEARREAKKSLDGRNSIRQQRYEEYGLDLVRVAVSVVRDIVNDLEERAKVAKPKKGEKPSKASYTVEAKGQDGLTRLDFNEVVIDEENYKLTVKPASPVPTDPAGLKAHGQEMLDLGLWTPDVLAEYWQDLDSEGRTNTTVAKRQNLRKKFDLCLYEGKPLLPPDEFTDFAVAMQVGLEMKDLGEKDGVPEKNLERLRRYLRQVKRLDTATKNASAPAAPPVPNAPAPAPAPADGAPPPG